MTHRFSFLSLVVLLIVALVIPAAAGGELDTDLSNVRKRITSLQRQIEDAGAQRSEIARDVVAVGDRLEKAEIAYTTARAKSERLTNVLVERQAALAKVRAELAVRYTQLAETRMSRDSAQAEAEGSAMQAYMSGGIAQPDIAFSASAIVEVSVGVGYLDVLTGFSSSAAERYEAVVVAEERAQEDIRNLEVEIVREVDDLQTTKSEVDVAATEFEESGAVLVTELAGHQTLLNKVDAAVAEFEGEISALASEESSIKRKIAAEAAAARAAAQPEPKPSTKAKPETPARTAGKLVRPVPGAVSSGFGQRTHPITGKVRMHNGVDMHGGFGQPILAAEDGKVILAGVKGGYGNAVMIDHGGGMVTLYAHQQKLGVRSGQWVKAGQVIGWVGSSGQSTGPHLHFEVRINGDPRDPQKYM
ncbi:MAG: peptidoglycan DD-metalloendopeptidase family protein [Actinomycetia bacterium]|nr:peptidoglycan DD-metalloendopeptidase family protein [Actinomycetes bacterium]